ncbi:MAG: rRNA maturation RNase YbeY [Candidatus Abawacabacteria bacterium]|nr:rRNA maturation RNase YbeY [Candidatus Abawacabacteria bacterium]
MPRSAFEPHVQEVILASWREVSSWFSDQYKSGSLEIYLVSDKKMRILNKQYRDLDKVTDVISLDFGEDPLEGKMGVIYLARGLVKKIADHFGHSVADEIVFLVVHGILHVWGYDHEKKSDEKKMLAATKIVLQNFPQYTPMLATYKPRSLIDY